LRYLEDSILYVCALLSDRPCHIDQFIDYFGSPTRDPGSHFDAPDSTIPLPRTGFWPRTGRAIPLALPSPGALGRSR